MAISAYSKTTWQNAPSEATPLNADNLNNIEAGVEQATNVLIALENAGVTPTQIVDTIKAVVDGLLVSGALYFENGHLKYEDLEGTTWDLNI